MKSSMHLPAGRQGARKRKRKRKREMERFYLWLKTLPSDTHDVDQIFLPGSYREFREKKIISPLMSGHFITFLWKHRFLFFFFFSSSGFGGDWSGGDGDASRGKRPRGKREKQLFKPPAGIWDVSGSHLISEVINWLIDRVVHPGLHGDNSRLFFIFLKKIFLKRRLKSGVSGRSGDVAKNLHRKVKKSSGKVSM